MKQLGKKTENIFAGTGKRRKIIGYKIGFDSDQQVIRYTGGGCVVPGVVVFHYGTEQEDKFYFEDGGLVYMAVTIKSVELDYLAEIYNKCAREKCGENEFIDKVKEIYTMKKMGF